MEGKFFVNPGSATGAVATGWGWEGKDSEVVPTFCLMDVQGDVLVLYVYELRTDEKTGAENVAVEKVSYRKQPAAAAVQAQGQGGGAGAAGVAAA